MKISASLMCANQLEMLTSITCLIKLDVDQFHFDIMDGNFVNNLALNINVIKQARQLTRIPFDIHLMVQKPSQYFDELIDCGSDVIIFHVETLEDIQKNIDYLKSKNVKIGLALHQETPTEAVERYLPYIDYLLIMTVKTGFSGLKFNELIYDKINYLYSYIKNRNYDVKIVADGGIPLENIKKLYENGVDIVVAGTSMLFNNKGFSNNIDQFKNLLHDLPERKIRSFQDFDNEIKYNAAVLIDVNHFELQRKTLRQLKENEVVVKVMSCGVCGSDLVRVYEKGAYLKNIVLGHEFSGTVIKTNESDKYLLNQKVAVFPLIPCKNCEYCKSEKYNLCTKYSYLGSRTDGGLAEMVIVPKENLITLQNNISYDEAALIEPMAVALRGLKKLNNLSHSNVLILGLGPVGILCGMLCKVLGVTEVIGIDRNGYKCDSAKSVGFDDCIKDGTSIIGKQINIIIDCCGSSKLLDENIKLMKKEGSILIIGNHEKNFILSPESMSSIIRGEIKIIFSWNSLAVDNFNNDWKICKDYLSKGKINVKPLITHTVPLDDVIKIFDKIHNKEIESIKVIVNPN